MLKSTVQLSKKLREKVMGNRALSLLVAVVVVGGIVAVIAVNKGGSGNKNSQNTGSGQSVTSDVSGGNQPEGSLATTGTSGSSDKSNSQSSSKKDIKSSAGNSATDSGATQQSSSSGGSGSGQTSSPPTTQPSPITGWQANSSTPDQCSGGSQGDRIYCAPGQVATYYITTTRGTTIKSYSEVNGLDSGALAGVTVNYALVSASELRVQVSSDRTRDNFSVTVNIAVNELASPQQQSTWGGWFTYKAGCTSSPKMSGCAP